MNLTKAELQARIDELGAERTKLQEQLQQIELAEDRKTYSCGCVRLNWDIKIYDCREQERCGRRGLGLGLVSALLSALKDCPVCHGTGKPTAIDGGVGQR